MLGPTFLSRDRCSRLAFVLLAVAACSGRASSKSPGADGGASGVSAGSASGAASASAAGASGAFTTTASGAASGVTGASTGSASCPGPSRYVDNTGACVCATNANSLTATGPCTCRLATQTLCTSDAGQPPQCVDTTSDPNNCGGCGMPCKVDATCHAGACGPEPTELVPEAPGCISIRAVYDSGNIYWADLGHGTISSIPTGGGPITTIAANQQIAALQDEGALGPLMWPSGPLATALLVHAGTVYWVGASSPLQCPTSAHGACSGGVGTTLMSATAGSAPNTLLTMASDPGPSPVSASDASDSIEIPGQDPPINAIALSPDGNTLYFAAGTRFYSIPSAGGGAVTYVGFTNGPEQGEATALAADASYLYYPSHVSGNIEALSIMQMCDGDAAIYEACPARLAQGGNGEGVHGTIEVQGNFVYWGYESSVHESEVPSATGRLLSSPMFPNAAYQTSLTGFVVGTENAYFAEPGTDTACSQDLSTACVPGGLGYVCPEASPPNQTCVPVGYIEKGAAPPFDGPMPSAVVIARDQPSATSFALDGTRVYWTTSRCDIDSIADSPQ